jgi:hypothetical protein
LRAFLTLGHGINRIIVSYVPSLQNCKHRMAGTFYVPFKRNQSECVIADGTSECVCSLFRTCPFNPNLISGPLGMLPFFSRYLLAKFCLLLSCLIVGVASHCSAQELKKLAPLPRKESGQLPKVPTVESMLRPNPSLEDVFSRTPNESAYERASFQTESRSRTSNGDVAWDGSLAAWTAPAFYTRPLYFEQPSFERYASNSPEWTRPAISYAQFLGSVPVMPYKLGANSPRSRIYTAGHYPYDHIAPPHSNRTNVSKRGLLFQGAAVTGLIFFVP